MDALLPLHNSNKELQSVLRSAPLHGLETLPVNFKKHHQLFVKFKEHSEQTNYIQAYKHTVELLITHLATNSFFNPDILEFIALSAPMNLFAHCIYILKRPNKTNLTYQNSLTLLLYTLQPGKLAVILTSYISIGNNSPIINTNQQTFIQNLCSIPDLVMNRLSQSLLMVESNKDYTHSPIYPLNFYQLISEVIFKLLSDGSDKTGVFISFIANIFNRISVFGHADIVARNLITFVENRITDKAKKLDILKTIISQMMPNRLEKLLESLFSQYFTPKLGKISFFSKILLHPDSCPRVKTMLIDTFITTKHYPISRINLLHNLIHYLCVECESLIFDVLESILNAFKSVTYMYSISLEQHRYLCRVIILIIRYYTCKIDPDNANSILQKIKNDTLGLDDTNTYMLKFPSNFPRDVLLRQIPDVIGTHLSTTRSEIQFGGQLCGEMLVSWINKELSNKLSFDLSPTDPIAKEFRKLLTSQHEKPPVVKVEKSPMNEDEVADSELASAKILSDMQKMFEEEKPNEILLPYAKTRESADYDDEIQTLRMPTDLPTEKKRPLIEILSDDSDSDDLEPYPSTMDVTVVEYSNINPIQGPFTLRECLYWLGENTKASNPIEKRKIVEAALNKAETLIRTSHDVKIWSRDLVKTLLFYGDEFNIENMNVLRVNSLVAILVFDPVETAKFLTSEFFKNHNVLMTRLDILTCLDRGACELSHITESSIDLSSLKMPLPRPKEIKNDSKVWEDIINERLKAKTRIISSVRQKPKTIDNTFGQLVGYFFYPLLYNYDHQVRCMDLLQRDHWLLSCVLKTIGSLVIYAQGTLALRNMVAAILDFIIAIKSIDFPLVKQGICFCILCVLEVSPVFYLLPDLSSRLEEIGQFLENIDTRDADEKTRQIAGQTLAQVKIILPVL